ncbi:hypothetical protein SAMN05216403_10466 [Nitrosospira multiformis ATCC 25196]|uniref:Uncharacterized protein n=1 Tax=Nitrosospira multiformis (strain ATCC 25196 / NCIMB 11849 / C 71) TaxID=323848 RepID=A0A1H5T9X7_NITMU|nr:hypothetical protein SAMN05216403_10466 [Nitrosospira multiformis ATCC 25196]
MQRQLQTHAAFSCKKPGEPYCRPWSQACSNLGDLRQGYGRNFTLHPPWLPRLDLARNVSDLEFDYCHSGRAITQAADFCNRSANFSPIAIQRLGSLGCKRGFLGFLCGLRSGFGLLFAHHG